MFVILTDPQGPPGNTFRIGEHGQPIALVQALTDYAVSNGAKVVEVRLGWREQVAERQEAQVA